MTTSEAGPTLLARGFAGDEMELDEDAVRAEVTALADAAKAMTADRWELRLAVRKLLSAEQVAQLGEAEPRWLRQRWVPRPSRLKQRDPAAAAR